MLRLLRPLRASASDSSAEVTAAAVDPLRAVAERAASGDANAERTLLVTLGPSLLRAVRGVLGSAHPEVEDVLQEAMVALLHALSGFRGECRVSHFATRVAVQVAMNARRRAGYRHRYTPSTEPDEVARLARDERLLCEERAAAERRNALRRLLDELPVAKAEALALHVVLGYSVAETAAATGVPPNTVRSRLRAALAELRARIRASDTLLELLEQSP